MERIFIKDRLPTKEESKSALLVCDTKQGVGEADFRDGVFNYPYYGQDLGGAYQNVIAWSKMPSPPITHPNNDKG